MLFKSPLTYLDELNRFEAFVNSFDTIATSTGRRMYVITLLCEMQLLRHKLQVIGEHWKVEYPIEIDREDLVTWAYKLAEGSDQYILKLSKHISDNYMELLCYSRTKIQRNPDFKAQKNEETNAEETYEDMLNESPYIKKGFYGMIGKRLSKLHDMPLPIKTEFENLDAEVFDNVLNNTSTNIFCMARHIGCELKDDAKDVLNKYRDFLFALSDDDLDDLIGLHAEDLHGEIAKLIQILDEPTDEACSGLYYSAEELLRKHDSYNENRNQQWRRYNSMKRDYHERLIRRKDDLRASIASQLWNDEWKDLFELDMEIVDIQPDALAIGNFIQFHLAELQQDNNRLLIQLMLDIEDWLFLTWEEMTLVDFDVPEGETPPISNEVVEAIKADMVLFTRPKANGISDIPPQINVQNYIANQTNVDKSFAPIINNENGGKIITPIASNVEPTQLK